MTTSLAVLGATLFLAFANGANDNFKGVATLYGSATADFQTALWWATATTLAGSVTAAAFAHKLVALFSGQGLVGDAIAGEPAFALAVILGAGLTVFGTARAGIPISTTHALTGGLAGAGLAAAAGDFNAAPLIDKIVIPLAVAPLIPIVIIGIVYPFARAVVVSALASPEPPGWARALRRGFADELAFATLGPDRSIPRDQAGTTSAQAIAPAATFFRALHFVSAGAVGFARGLNDTPKLLAIALAANVIHPRLALVAIALAMAAGGLLQSRRIAETMAKKITHLSPGEGTLANLVTSLTVLVASKLGVPVSTTHVSVGAIFGIGVATREANIRVLGTIVSAWVLTLPAAMAAAATIYRLFAD